MTVGDAGLGSKVGFEVLAVDDPKRAFEWLFIRWLAVVTEESAWRWRKGTALYTASTSAEGLEISGATPTRTV
jgi:hypothetical protein